MPGPLEMACFPFRDEAVNSPGSLLKSECRKPLMDGVSIYFTAHSGDMTVDAGAGVWAASWRKYFEVGWRANGFSH